MNINTNSINYNYHNIITERNSNIKQLVEDLNLEDNFSLITEKLNNHSSDSIKTAIYQILVDGCNSGVAPIKIENLFNVIVELLVDFEEAEDKDFAFYKIEKFFKAYQACLKAQIPMSQILEVFDIVKDYMPFDCILNAKLHENFLLQDWIKIIQDCKPFLSTQICLSNYFLVETLIEQTPEIRNEWIRILSLFGEALRFKDAYCSIDSSICELNLVKIQSTLPILVNFMDKPQKQASEDVEQIFSLAKILVDSSYYLKEIDTKQPLFQQEPFLYINTILNRLKMCRRAPDEYYDRSPCKIEERFPSFECMEMITNFLRKNEERIDQNTLLQSMANGENEEFEEIVKKWLAFEPIRAKPLPKSALKC